MNKFAKMDSLSEITKLIAAKTGRDVSDGWLPLWMHHADTAGIMEKLFLFWLPRSTFRKAFAGISEDEMRRLCIFTGLVHDLGKASAVFQSRILIFLPEVRDLLAKEGMAIPRLEELPFSDASPHALASESILQEMGCPPSIAAVAGAHHGKPREDIKKTKHECQMSQKGYGTNYYGTNHQERWRDVWSECIEYALNVAEIPSLNDLPVISMAGQIILTGLLIMADWIASNTTYFPLIDCVKRDLSSQYPARVQSAWEKLSLPAPWEPGIFHITSQMFQTRFSFAPNMLQQAVISVLEQAEQPGLMVIEAEMGSGKTEGALAAAELLASQTSAGGIFFGLPTQATANGIFTRLERWAEGQSLDTVLGIRLAHGMVELNDDYQALFSGTARQAEDEGEGLTVHPWFQGPKQALLSNFVIGTIDQLLLAALRQKHVMLRHLGLAGKVVIIDECHAYDTYMNQYLERVLAYLGEYGVPSILLSATLPADRRAKLVDAYRGEGKILPNESWRSSRDYPLLTWTDGQKVDQKKIPSSGTRHTVFLKKIGEDEVMPRLQSAVRQGGCAGVIVNTVRRAQEWAERIQVELADAEVMVLHAQFLMPDRAERERVLLNRLGKKSVPEMRKKLIIVGTQVLEQSLDIDFDLLITDLCPMDLLLQRIGRLHRHPRVRPKGMEQAQCLILGASEQLEAGTSAIYGDWLLLRTLDALPTRIELPKDIPQLVQNVYDFEGFPSPDAELYSQAWKAYQLKQKKQRRSAKEHQVAQPCPSEQKLITGWLDDSTDVNEIKAQAAVRDGRPSIDVLVFVRDKSDMLHMVPWQNGGMLVRRDVIPSRDKCHLLLRQRLPLPSFLCEKYRVDRVTHELEEVRRIWFPKWAYAPELADKLLLLLDENLDADLDGEKLHYSRTLGLVYGKKEK